MSDELLGSVCRHIQIQDGVLRLGKFTLLWGFFFGGGGAETDPEAIYNLCLI